MSTATQHWVDYFGQLKLKDTDIKAYRSEQDVWADGRVQRVLGRMDFWQSSSDSSEILCLSKYLVPAFLSNFSPAISCMLELKLLRNEVVGKG